MPVIICQGWRRKTNSAYIECNIGQAQRDCNSDTAVFADKRQAGYSVELDTFSRAFALSLITGMPVKGFSKSKLREPAGFETT